VGGAARATFFAMNHLALHAADPGPVLEAPPAWPRLGEIEAPTLVLCGDLDLPLMMTLCGQLAQKFPGARYEVLPGLAHLPSLESPQTFNAALKRFMDGLVDAV
jgi:pimeloyl-ACP methyl ester carboxylesterase